MTSRVATITTSLAILVATAAIGAPAASADPPYTTTASQGQSLQATTFTHQFGSLPHVDHSVLVVHRASRVPNGTGFDWAAAGIGALTATMTCIVLIGVLLDIRRRRVPTVA